VFTSARRSMPAIDYVSIVKSVYTDRRAMVMGSSACIVGAGVTGLMTGSPVLWGIAC
jgi:threonine dehydrogenase-like Zn-dependent dehydrogenase